MKNNKHYLAIAEFYGDQTASRSGVRLICHVNEGLALLDMVGAPLTAKEAFCLHPMLQDDAALRASMAPCSVFQRWRPDPAPTALAMEYRRVANAYLSHHCADDNDVIALSPLVEVNQMLLADKVQNRKDFERYHRGTHTHSARLERYFQNWLRRLGVSEPDYAELLDSLAALARGRADFSLSTR